MAIIKGLKNLIKRDKTAEEIAEKHKEEAREAREEKQKKAEKIEKKTSHKEEMGQVGLLVVRGPHFSEKASYIGQNDKYVFKIYSDVNKIQVKNAIEKLYGVTVLSVNIINIPPKKIRVRGKEGKKSGYKKAMVTLKEGHKIEI